MWGTLQEIPFSRTEAHFSNGPLAVDGYSIFAASTGPAISRLAPSDASLSIEDDDPAPFMNMPAAVNVSEMPGQSVYFYINIPLTNTGPDGSFKYETFTGTARLGRDFDLPASMTGSFTPGWVEAYIARIGAPAPLTANSTALIRWNGTWMESSHPIPSAAISAAQPLLAIHGLNYQTTDSDFLILPEIYFHELPPQVWLDWISSSALPSSSEYLPSDDMDQDGLENIAEYVLGLQPDMRDKPQSSLIA